MEENDSRQYQINISGNRFSISSPYGEEHVREVEKFLDQQIAEVTEHTDAFGPTNVALLVALNLADKLLSLKKESQSTMVLKKNWIIYATNSMRF